MRTTSLLSFVFLIVHAADGKFKVWWSSRSSHLPPVSVVSWDTQPTQQRTLDKLPAELRCRNFVDKHRLRVQVGASNVQKKNNVHATCTYSD